jgi:hypothetical protein
VHLNKAGLKYPTGIIMQAYHNPITNTNKKLNYIGLLLKRLKIGGIPADVINLLKVWLED